MRPLPRKDLRRRRLAVAVLAALLTAACGHTGERVSSRYVSPSAWEFVAGVMASGPFLVEILGEPYPVSHDVLAAVVLSEMARAITWNSGVRFTTDPQLAANRRMRIIVAFNGGPGGAGQCRSGAGGGGPDPAGAVRANITLCDADQLLSDVSGRIVRSHGIDDPALAGLIRQMTQTLLPYPPDQDRNGLRVPFM